MRAHTKLLKQYDTARPAASTGESSPAVKAVEQGLTANFKGITPVAVKPSLTMQPAKKRESFYSNPELYSVSRTRTFK